MKVTEVSIWGEEEEGWRPLLFHDTAAQQPDECDAFVVVSASVASGELVAGLSLQPIRMTLASGTIEFLLQFLNSAHLQDDRARSESAASDDSQETVDGDAIPTVGLKAGGLYIQKVVMRPLHLRLDYVPKGFSLSELTSVKGVGMMVPVKDMRISIGRMETGGHTSWEGVAQYVKEWLPKQLWPQLAPNYPSSIAPVSSLVNVSSACADLLLALVRPVPLRSLAHGGHNLARAVGVETLGFSSRAADFLHLVLRTLDSAAGPVLKATSYYPEGAAATALSHLSNASEAAVSLRDAIDPQRANDVAATAVQRH